MSTYDELYQQGRREREDRLYENVSKDDIDRLKHRIESQTMVPVTRETKNIGWDI